MNFYEQIFSRGRATGEGMTHFERLFAAKFGGSPPPEVREYTGAVPVTITADGTPLIDYLITGNTTQTGTPTSDNPVMPQGTGERTGNLVEVSNSNCIIFSTYDQFTITNDIINITGNALFGFIVKCSPNTQYTVSSTRTGYNCDMRIREYSEKPSDWTNDFITQSVNVGSATRSVSFTTNSATKYILVCFYGSNTSKISDVMLNTGSTALPYEPFGVKIPISSADTTTPVYLGEVESTRRIYKLVLTGQESWYVNSTGNTQFFFTTVSNEAIPNSEIICTHFENANIGQTTTVVGVGFAGTVQLRVRPENTSAETVISFKQWLIDQYAAGTPVTIWYVLATPETAVVNEPLMKIGDYADTLSKTQAGVEIPTNNGSTTVDVDTTVKPSEVYIKYMG